MKHLYIFLLFALVLPFQAAKAETLALETVIEQALQNSPETARILNTFADADAEELISKMPGIVVQDGKVQAQGEDVQEVTVDGRPFSLT